MKSTLHPRAYLLILYILIPNCGGIVAGGWWNFSMSLKGLLCQVKILQKFNTGKQCLKYAQIGAFSDPYFPVYGQNHIRIFPYWAELESMSKYGKIRIRFCPYAAKHGSEKARILTFFTQWSLREGVLIFIKVGSWRSAVLLQIYFLDNLYHICTTAIFYSTYYQRTYFEDRLLTSANNAK